MGIIRRLNPGSRYLKPDDKVVELKPTTVEAQAVRELRDDLVAKYRHDYKRLGMLARRGLAGQEGQPSVFATSVAAGMLVEELVIIRLQKILGEEMAGIEAHHEDGQVVDLSVYRQPAPGATQESD